MSSTAKYYLRQQVKQGRWSSLGITTVEENDVVDFNIPALGAEVEEDKFDINERFQFVYQFAKAAGEKKMPSVILTGPGGVGKTDTVMQGLEAAGMVNYRTYIDTDVIEAGDEIVLTAEMDASCYVEISGCTTARGLYNTLYEHRNRTIVFDDCDDVWGDSRALDILKAALDSYDERWVSWGAQASFGDTIPRAFRFNGSIIFISNLMLRDLNKPVRTRSVCVDLSMTVEQMMERMTMIANSPRFMPHIDMDTKRDCLSLIDSIQNDVRELSIRTLITVIKIKLACENWERVAEYAICR